MAWNYQITDSYGALTQAQQTENAEQFATEMLAKGWTLEAICGALGNMQYEGLLNPGQCENGWGVPASPTDFYYAGGLGLIQWSNGYGGWPNCLLVYANETGRDWWNGNTQCNLIDLADDNSVTHGYWGWIPRGPWTNVTTMRQFSRWTGTVADAASCWCWCCEYPANIESVIPVRQVAATDWYTYFEGHPPAPGRLSTTLLAILARKRGNPIWWRW